MTNELNQDAKRKLTKARALMLLDQPFFGSLALRLQLSKMPEAMAKALFDSRSLRRTMAVDGRTVYFDEQYVLDEDMDIIKSSLAHEVLHCAFSHITRRGHRDSMGWNAAGDYAINLVLKDSGFTVPDQWLLDPQYKGMSADEIYNKLPKGGGGGGGGGGGAPACHIMDGGTDEAERGASEADWKIATNQAAAQAKEQGKLPGSLERFVEQMNQSKVDWRGVLQRFVSQRAKNDYSWTRPNRRYLAMGMYFPSLYSEEMENLVVVTDDSGSIGQKEMEAFCAEVNAARDVTKPRRFIHISCDADVNHYQEYDQDEPFVFASKGGGGTDFRPPFAKLKEMDVSPTALIYITDMYGSFPAEDPGYPVLWCATSDVIGPFGETVKLEL